MHRRIVAKHCTTCRLYLPISSVHTRVVYCVELPQYAMDSGWQQQRALLGGQEYFGIEATSTWVLECIYMYDLANSKQNSHKNSTGKPPCMRVMANGSVSYQGVFWIPYKAKHFCHHPLHCELLTS